MFSVSKPRMFRESRSEFHEFLASSFDRDRWSTSQLYRFIQGKDQIVHLKKKKACLDPRACLIVAKKKREKSLAHAGIRIPESNL
jgi:hypothetical protein